MESIDPQSAEYDHALDVLNTETERLFALALVLALYATATELPGGSVHVVQHISASFASLALANAVKNTGIQLPVAMVAPKVPPAPKPPSGAALN